MKRAISAVLTLAMVFGLCACSSSAKLWDEYDEDEVIAVGTEVVDHLHAQEFQEVTDMCSDSVKESLSPDICRGVYDSYISKFGDLIEYSKITTCGGEVKDTGEKYAVVVITAKYSNTSKHKFTISLDSDLEIIGLYVK